MISFKMTYKNKVGLYECTVYEMCSEVLIIMYSSVKYPSKAVIPFNLASSFILLRDIASTFVFSVFNQNITEIYYFVVSGDEKTCI